MMRPVFPDRCCRCIQSKRDSGRSAGFRSASRELPALARLLLSRRQSGHGTERPQCRQFWRRPALEPWHPPARLLPSLFCHDGTASSISPKLVGAHCCCKIWWVLKKSVFLKTAKISVIENVYPRRERRL